MTAVKMREPRVKSAAPSASPAQDARPVANVVTDSRGRRLTVKKLGALDKLRLFEAVGGDLAKNEVYLGMATLAASVSHIDGVLCDPMFNKRSLEQRVDQLGDEGIEALTTFLVAAGLAETTAGEG